MPRILALLSRLESRAAKFIIFIGLAAVIAASWAGYLDGAREILDSERLTFVFGDVSFSAWMALRALVATIFLFWIAALISSSGAKQLRNISQLRSSNRSLLIKAFQAAVYFLLFLILLDVLGIDPTALVVLGGGLGIGIGFGLQKIAANFVSGLILLFEKSVEEGDLIELDTGIYGFARTTNARYTLVESFDGREVMVPNEDFITNRVVNWTFSNQQGRVEIPVGVSYGSDIERARELILEAARSHPRCSTDPEPQCYLRQFGDSSVDFLLLFWVDDVTQGRYEPQSDVMRAIWKSFGENGITIPFPQRDVHMHQPAADGP